MNNKQIAHRFAHRQYTSSGLKGSNLFIDGKLDTIYSFGYHFPIAKWVNDFTLLFNLSGYSPTTSKHKSMVLGAMPDTFEIIAISNDIFKLNSHGEADCIFIANELTRILDDARLIKREKGISGLIEEINGILRYCELFGINIGDDLILKAQSVKSEFETILKVNEEKNRQRQIKRDAKKIEDFKAFKIANIWLSREFTYLRFNAEKQRIETSKGVEIPVKIAKEFYLSLKSGNLPEKILDFDTNSYDGTVLKIGCHIIPQAEIDAIAKQLNW